MRLHFSGTAFCQTNINRNPQTVFCIRPNFFSLHISTYLFIVVYASKNVLSERRALQADVAPSTYRGRDQVMTVPRDSDKDCIRRD